MRMFSVPHTPNSLCNIYRLGIKNQMLMSRALDLRSYGEAKRFQQIDRALLSLLHKEADFDFVGQIAQGRTLLVGEGNLSFALSLTRQPVCY